ncbi:MAG: LAGLIDADG homing endonuclease [Parcubacteria group bacterium GW2011_GWA2_47_8]|nr:MAG: LAGLIDADG homing endonuclease [Parcubacteria group bacterium GW2011_GWA2_47_8]OHB19701.1 MAG: hypothetical protein A2666_04160 [Parcubacteria group bacterium RIFCSPHIGHO2_01_FULL_47_10b]
MISSRENAIIIGTILGDGHLRPMKSSARLEVVHCEAQKQYVFWKYHELRRFVGATPHRIVISDDRYQKKYVQWRFKTLMHDVFRDYRRTFHLANGRKAIPKNIASLLTSSLSLATWFMDDGGRRNDSYGLFLNTLSFTKREHGVLRKCLKENFSLDSRIHWIQDGYRLYIPSKDAKHFCELVYPFIIPPMRYKLSYNPVTTSFARLDRARDRKGTRRKQNFL